MWFAWCQGVPWDMVVTGLMLLFLVPFASLSHIPISPPELPSLTSQISSLLLAPYLRVSFWGTQTKAMSPNHFPSSLCALLNLSYGPNSGPSYCLTTTYTNTKYSMLLPCLHHYFPGSLLV